RQRPRCVAPRRRAGRDRGHPRAGVLVLARLLRRRARGPPPGGPHPGPARLLRRPHLPARRPRGYFPHRVVGRPLRAGGVTTPVSSTSTAAQGTGATASGPGFRPVIVGSDIGVYALARSFHERYAVRTTVVAFAEPGPIAHSRIVDTVLSGVEGEQIVAALRKVATDLSARHPGERLLLLTNMDWVVRVLAHRRAELESAGFVLPFADVALIDRISDKAEFQEICT